MSDSEKRMDEERKMSMGVWAKFKRRFGIFGRLLSYLRQNKMWWMIPMVVVLGTFALLAAAAAISGIAPTIYILW